MKGKISKDLEAILHDDEGRKQLKDSLISGKDSNISVGNKNYRISTRTSVYRSSSSGKFVTREGNTSFSAKHK